MKRNKFLLVSLLLAYNIFAYAQTPEIITLTDKEIAEYEQQAATVSTASKLAATSNNTYVPSSVTLDRTKTVGEIPFSSEVSSSGAMTYNVPIDIYPGINGFQPQISLAYNHLAGNGIAGVGWGIGGLSSITHAPLNWYYDGMAVAIIQPSINNAFVLDGMRLIKLSGTSYQTEQGYIKVNATTSGNALRYFEVLYPNGNKATYGYTTNTANKLYYPLTKLSDIWGNEIIYNYTFANNQYKITDITYNGASVEFQYATRPDIISTYEAGLNLVENQYLSAIVCKFGTTTLRTYNLTYETKQNVSTLKTIGCTASGKSLPPLQFYYGEGNTANVFTSAQTQLITYFNYGNSPEQIKVVKGKLESGTDNDEIIVLRNKNPYYLASGATQYVNQYNANDSIIFYTGFDKNRVGSIMQTEANFIDILCADINGKQGEEVIKVNNGMSSGNDRVIFKVSQGASQRSLIYTRTFDLAATLPNKVHPKYYYTGDFNGDGKMEVLAVSCNNPLGTTVNSKCYLFDLESNIKLYEDNLFAFNVDFSASDNSDRIFIADFDGEIVSYNYCFA